MANTILIRRGLSANLPASAPEGEPFFCTDTNQLFIGTGTGMTLVSGGGGGGSSFSFTQSIASSTWVIVHNLGAPVSVTVQDSTNTEVEVETHFDSINQVTLKFSAPESGSATCIA